MSTPIGTTRRDFLKTSLATAGTAALSRHLALGQIPGQTPPPAKYRRYNVTSPAGQKALASYAKAIQIMLKLPPAHPHNWFRNAFVHLMDCPHGNWWFYVWHRGYVGYFEQTIRNLSGDPDFAMPYWDWTQLPQIPDSMFDGVLTPNDSAYEPFTRDIETFTSFIRPTLEQYWKVLSHDRVAQLNVRGYTSFEAMWKDVTGVTATEPKLVIDHENMAFARNPDARYLTRSNPNLSPKVTYNVSMDMVEGGLAPIHFFDPKKDAINFNSSKTPSHNTGPNGDTKFSTLEGFPHNSTHNYIGGVDKIPGGPYGNMTNNLSPVDPLFFLHHSNMDRLWDVWTRKQQALHLPYLPDKTDLPGYGKEPFLFFVDGNGHQVGPSTAKEYISMTRFDYDYEPGFGEELVKPARTLLKAKHPMTPAVGMLKGNSASLMLSPNEINSHLATDSSETLFARVTVPRPTEASPNRDFDVLVGAPANVTQADPGSPYYAGMISFFGGIMHMPGMTGDATFIVPLPKRKEAFTGLKAGAVSDARSIALTIRVVPSGGGASVLKDVTVYAQ